MKLYKNQIREDDILGRVFDEFDQESGYNRIYGWVLDAFFKIIHTPEFPVDKVTFIQKDHKTVLDTYKGAVVLTIEQFDKPGRKDIEMKKEKEKAAAAAKGAKQAKPSFEPEFLEKTVILPTLTEKTMIIAKNPPFEVMIRNNILECIYQFIKIDTETETKEDIRQKIEVFVNETEDACIRKLKAIDNLDDYEYEVTTS